MSHITVNDIHRLIDAKMRRHEAMFHGLPQPPEPIEPQIEPQKYNRFATTWHQAISDLHDLVALSVYRNYITHSQTSELLDVLKRLRIMVNRYEKEE